MRCAVFLDTSLMITTIMDATKYKGTVVDPSGKLGEASSLEKLMILCIFYSK